MRLVSWASLATATLILGACGATPPTAPDAVPLPPVTGGGGGTGGSAGAATAVGTFRGVGHIGRGSVRFTMADGVATLEFSSDFEVSGVPGPFVYLNTTTNANTGSPLRISALRSNNGTQSYTFQLPAGVNYRYVLIWCDPFNTAVAEAALAAGPASLRAINAGEVFHSGGEFRDTWPHGQTKPAR
ncbi:MAG: DM13 domain-containing protein [Gemmatimonadales bacterium]